MAATGGRQMILGEMSGETFLADSFLAKYRVPVSQFLLTYLLFWPLLCLIARQAPYLAGPARDANSFQQGRSGGEASGYHANLYLIMAVQAVCAASAFRGVLTVLKRNLLVVAGLVLTLVSALWSESRINTFHLFVELALTTLFACYLAIRMPTERLMRQLMFMGVGSSVLSIVFAVALPGYGIFAGYSGGAWQGICDHKNTLGLSMAYLLTPAFFVEGCRRWQRIGYVGLILFLIVMSQSRGAWIYTVGVLSFVLCLHLLRRLNAHESMVLSIILFLLLVAISAVAIASFGALASSLGKDVSMSGRTDIYREVWTSIRKAPLLGYGYGGFWGVSPEAIRIGDSINWPNIGYSENGVLELALQLGFVGVFLVLLMVGRAFLLGFRLLRSPSWNPRIGWFLTILFLAALTNIDAGWLLATGTLDWILILVACIGLEAEARRARKLADAPEYPSPSESIEPEESIGLCVAPGS